MSYLLINVLTFCAASLAVLGVGSLIHEFFFRHSVAVAERLNDEFNVPETGAATLFKDLSQLTLDAQKQRPSRWKRFAQLVEQSGLNLSPERLLSLAFALGWLLGSVAFLVCLKLWIGLIGFVVGFALPLLWIPLRRRRRIALLRRQLPDAFDLMSRAVQAGQTVTSALQVVADNFDDLLATEFSCCHEQQRMGLPMQVALADLARRTGVVEMRMFAVALSVQRQSGGNPVEMLTNLATVIRKRVKLLDRVKALTGEGRMQALVLLLLPILLFTALYFFNRDYVEELFKHPAVLVGAFISQLCGAFFIYKLVNFDY